MNLRADIYFGFAIGIIYKNEKPKRKNFKYSEEFIMIFLPFIAICFEWKRDYSPTIKNQ